MRRSFNRHRQGSMARKAIFLDRDGTIARDVNYCRRSEDFQLLPRADEAVALLNQAGFRVVVVTNQSGLGRGYFTLTALDAIHAKLHQELSKVGAWVDAIYHCAHAPKDRCVCRKPGSALLQRAADELDLSLGESYTVGDKASDVLAGRAAGTRTILVRSDQSPVSTAALQLDYETTSLYEAAQWILARESSAIPRSAITS